MRLLEAPEKLFQLQLGPVSRPAPRMQRSRHPCSVLSRAASSAATEPKARIERSAGLNLKRLPELPIGIPAAALQKAASQALSLAESLRTPDGAISKQGSSGGQMIRASKHQKVDHPAVDVVQARMREGSIPGKRKDAHKIGLVVEGGGMRGVVTGAALQAMHDLGMRDAFDAVYGSSAGAINATYFLSGQRDGVKIYTEEIANKDFIDLSRLINISRKTQAPALDLDFLLGIMHEKRPLDWEAVLSSNVPLKVVASCLDTLQPVILEGFTDAKDLETCLRASANVPEIAGRPILHRGKRLVDAAVFEAVPFRAAIADGCTHIITLCSRPPLQGGHVAKLVDSLVSDAVKRLFLNPEYMRAAWMREVENSMIFGMTTDEMLLRGLDKESHRLPHFSGTHCYPIFPGDAAQALNPLCISVPLLAAGMEEGRQMVGNIFGQLPEQSLAVPASLAAAQ